jgi:hypothetical protein
MKSEWFEGSKKGLEKIARRRGLSYVLFELVQNAWDTGAREVSVTFVPVEGRPLVDMVVRDDDPDGFKDLTHAWTLFAESERKCDPEKRGRFNLGEKLVLAVCESAEITSTKGTVRFDDEGRTVGRKRTESGSVFHGRVRMMRTELNSVLASARELIVPTGLTTTIDGERLAERVPLKTFEASLQTEVANEEGFLTARTRKTIVRVYSALMRTDPEGETRRFGYLYEMGIPVCPTGDQWDVEIMQKVPVNLERNAVSESYLRTVRVFTLNEMYDQLKSEDAATPAVQDALTDERCKAEAVNVVLTYQFGEKRAVMDPSDPEANNRLVAEGYTLISGNAFSRSAWENIRSSGAARPSGQIMPTPKPYSSDPDAPARKLLPESEWTDGMRNLAGYIEDVAMKLIKRHVRVTIDKGRIGAGWAACYGSGELTFNLASVGYDFFEHGPDARVNALLIHELAHEMEENHLSDGFYKALQKFGAALTELALRDPELFRRHGWKAGGS